MFEPNKFGGVGKKSTDLLHSLIALVPVLLLQPVTFVSVATYRVLFCMPHRAQT